MEEFVYIFLIVLNGINVFPLTNVLTCSPDSSGGSAVDYILTEACDQYMEKEFTIGPLSLESDHKPLYLDLTL